MIRPTTLSAAAPGAAAPGDFTNVVALVTGAASGMGRATAMAYAESGASVVLADLESDALRRTASELTDSGHAALAVACDVTDERQVATMIRMTVDTFGRLDVAFNNAGIQPDGQNTADVAAATFDRVIAVNLRGVWACMKHEILQMQRQGGGAIVNCSSVGGLVGAPGQAAYHASKHGVLGLTKSAALEYARDGIRINAVAPGTIDTPLVANIRDNHPDTFERIMSGTPMGRIGTGAEIAAAVLWLTGPGSAYVTGTCLTVDGGITAQ